VASSYPPLNLQVRTPRLLLAGATDELPERLIPWVTRRGEPALISRWKLTRDHWETTRRTDIELSGVEDCLPVLGL
jgi:hypothetical protein